MADPAYPDHATDEVGLTWLVRADLNPRTTLRQFLTEWELDEVLRWTRTAVVVGRNPLGGVFGAWDDVTEVEPADDPQDCCAYVRFAHHA